MIESQKFKKMKLQYFLFINIFICFTLFSFNCENESNNTNNLHVKDTKKVIPKKIILKANTLDSSKFIVGKQVEINMSLEKDSKIDSVQLFINEEYISSFASSSFSYSWDTKSTIVGTNKIRVTVFWEANNQRQEKKIVFLSDIEPEIHGYKVINTYNHDRGAYTQGLFFYEDVLYEATGLKGESSIRKTKIETGDILKSYSISGDIFGEGITFFDGKIIQLSWRANRGFVYDQKTFKKITEFHYSSEGWGLTNNETELIMSDGTNTIYFLETQSYSIIRQIEVFDNKGAIMYLNELEYINGELYANIYGTDKIAKIDTKTGKVISYIDLTGILAKKYIDNQTDVLNGIAYDKENDRFFVTGKKWAKLFEISITK